MTVRAVKFDRFPIKVPLRRPVLPRNLDAIDFWLEICLLDIRFWSIYMCTASCVRRNACSRMTDASF